MKTYYLTTNKAMRERMCNTYIEFFVFVYHLCPTFPWRKAVDYILKLPHHDT